MSTKYVHIHVHSHTWVFMYTLKLIYILIKASRVSCFMGFCRSSSQTFKSNASKSCISPNPRRVSNPIRKRCKICRISVLDGVASSEGSSLSTELFSETSASADVSYLINSRSSSSTVSSTETGASLSMSTHPPNSSSVMPEGAGISFSSSRFCYPSGKINFAFFQQFRIVSSLTLVQPPGSMWRASKIDKRFAIMFAFRVASHSSSIASIIPAMSLECANYPHVTWLNQ